MKSYVLTVDPGVKAMGFCWWDAKHWCRELKPPVMAEVYFSNRGENDRYECIRQIMERAAEVGTGGAKLVRVVCETPVMFHGATGRAVAVRGDLTDLAFSAGVVGSLALLHGKIPFEAAPADQWKGQMDKEMMQRRIIETLGQRAFEVLSAKRLHDWDACGIGLWAQGFSFK